VRFFGGGAIFSGDGRCWLVGGEVTLAGWRAVSDTPTCHCEEFDDVAISELISSTFAFQIID
jgi:hypothetical protein